MNHKVSAYERQYYCFLSVNLPLQEKRWIEKKRKGSTKSDSKAQFS